MWESNRLTTALLTVLVVTAGIGPTVAAQTNRDGRQTNEAYSGVNVSFDVTDSAVTNYSVDGTTMLGSVRTESRSSYANRLGLGLDFELSAVTSLEGAAVSGTATAETGATVETSGSARIRAHDTRNGHLGVAAGGESQVVRANVSADARASAESDSRVVVRTDDGTTGTFVVAGDGDVTVAEDGDVAASLSGDARLVFRAYPDGRSAADVAQERLIANGTAAVEVSVLARDGGTVTDTVTYSQGTNVTATQSAAETVEVTVDRARHEGKVVITSVSEAAVGAFSNVSVTVDGEAAVRAGSYSELRSAIGGDTSKFVVHQGTQANASTEVLVAVKHFSERTVRMSGGDGSAGTPTDGEDDATPTDDGTGDDSTGGDGGTDAPTDGSGGTTDAPDGTDDGGSGGGSMPGFGVLAAVAGVAGAALLATRRG